MKPVIWLAAGIIAMVAFGIISSMDYWQSDEQKAQNARFREAQRPYSPGQAPSRPIPPAPKLIATTNLMRVTMEAPCSKSSDTHRLVRRAVLDKDQEALDGLLSRGKIFLLTKGTRFEVSDTRDGVAWGFVRSGRNTGENCYIFSEVLSSNEVPLR